MGFRIFQKSSDHGSHRVSSLWFQGHESSLPKFFRSSYHSCCFNITKQKQVLRSMCPPAPLSQTHISRFFNLQPVIAHTARKQVASLHQLQSLTVHATAWAQYFNLAFTSSGSSPARANTDQQRTIVLLQKKINHKQNIIPWLKGAIYSLMEDIGSLLFVLLQKWALFFDLQKRTFSKGRIMLLQIYVTSFEEETCAGKAIA